MLLDTSNPQVVAVASAWYQVTGMLVTLVDVSRPTLGRTADGRAAAIVAHRRAMEASAFADGAILVDDLLK